jgi:hypothetical protein
MHIAAATEASRSCFAQEVVMQMLRIVYVSDETGRAETLTAAFTSRDAALAALAAAGLRALQIGELRNGERATDPVLVPIAAAAAAPAREPRIGSLALNPAH